MTRPEFPDLNKEQLTYLADLEKFREDADIDGMLMFYLAMNQKMLDMAKSVKDTTIHMDSDDKVVERFIKLGVEAKDIYENMAYLKNKLGITDLKAEVKKEKRNPIEEKAKKRGE